MSNGSGSPNEGASPSVTPVGSVYVHAPFCARRCFYCDFAVTVSAAGDLGGWLEAIADELRFVEEEGLSHLSPGLDTLYVGGGTPSTLGPGAMAGLAGVLGPDRLGSPTLEWTAEANPESFSREVAEAWSRAGVNRISLGAQSFQEAPLRWMGRLHGPEGPAWAVARARDAGISNLSLDLIFALPPGVERDWERDLDQALSLQVPHLSLYGLTVETGTPLGRAVAQGKIPAVDEDRYREEFLTACEVLTGAGYRQYELSNFALEGFECRHNRVYWEYRPYLGLGNSAHSFLPPLRRWNLRDWLEYQGSVREGRTPVGGEEVLKEEEIQLERIWLALRTAEGLAMDALSPHARKTLLQWVDQGWARREGDRVRLTPEGWLLLDHLAIHLDGARDGVSQYLDAPFGPPRS